MGVDWTFVVTYTMTAVKLYMGYFSDFHCHYSFVNVFLFQLKFIVFIFPTLICRLVRMCMWVDCVELFVVCC